MKPSVSLVVCLLAASLTATGSGVPQQQAPVFRAGVQTVPIYATVVDKAGRLVPNLEQEHFEILDNEKPQPLTIFRADVQPVAVVIALDMSASITEAIDVVKDASEAFVLRMLPADRARILTFDSKIRRSEEFTANRDALIRYLRTNTDFGNGTRLWDAIDEGLTELSSEPARKVVLVLTDGDDYGSNRSGDDVLARAQQMDVMIYAIGLKTRYRGGPQGQMVESRPDGDLKKLTEHTGGGHFIVSRATELNTTFSRVADELHRQYLMGFSPATLDGKLHRIDVRVKVPGMTARARRTYQAGPPLR